MIQREYKSIKVAELKAYEKNNKKHGANVDEIVKSIQANTYIAPIIIDENNVILAGHGRKLALDKLQVTEAEVLQVSGLSEEQKRDFRIRDNKLTELSDWDWDNLKIELEELDIPDLSDLFKDEEEMQEEQTAEEDDYEVPDEITTDIVLGDLFEIGEHRLLCGDSTCSDTVAKLMNGEKADMVFTDPPYRLKIGGNGAFKKAHDKMGEDLKDLIDFNPAEFLNLLPTVFLNGINAFIFCNTDLVPDYCNWAKTSKYNFNILTWHKTSFIPAGGNHHFPDTEYLIYISKKPIFNSGLDVNYGKYWVQNNEKSKDHPTIKPQEIIQDEILICSNKNSLVVDFFLGSGSTMVASHQLKRKCYGMELDPKYCQVIVDRMYKLDPAIQFKKNGQPYNPEIKDYILSNK